MSGQIGNFYSGEKGTVKPGFYHWSQIEKLKMAYHEDDDDGYLRVTLKPNQEPAEKASGMMWMWLRVSERGSAVKHPDASNQEHYEYIDEFDEWKKTETLQAVRKERKLITDHLMVRQIMIFGWLGRCQDGFYAQTTGNAINERLTRKGYGVNTHTERYVVR